MSSAWSSYPQRAFSLQTLPSGSSVEVVISGRLSDGTPFNARDFIRVP